MDEAKVKELHIPLDDSYMNVIRFGTGKKNLTVIAGVSLCGLEGMGAQLAQALDEFSREFTVYVFDRKRILPEGYTLNQMCDDVYRCLNVLGVTETCVYGASQGGMIGLLLALEHPLLVRKLVLCSAACRMNSGYGVLAQWHDAAKAHDVVRLNTLFLEHVYSETYRQAMKEYIPAFLHNGTDADCERFRILLEAMEGFDVSGRLSSIKCPVLVICDRNDKVISYRDGVETAERIGCEAVIYEDYSHAVYDEAPDLKQRILTFCAGWTDGPDKDSL